MAGLGAGAALTADIAIIGGGASGVMLAAALARQPHPVSVALVDPRPGRGLAYGAPHARHLLNTRVGNMSLDPQAPEDFLAWLNGRELNGPAWSAEDFAPRSLYGDYIEQRLADLQAGGAGARAPMLIRGRVQAAEIPRDGWLLRMASGHRVSARALVLATGWAHPRPLQVHGREEVGDLIQDDPWDIGALDALPAGARVLLIGTGLTALDAAIAIWERAPGASVTAISRHGMLPRIHGSPSPAAPALKPPYPRSARELYAKLRAVAEFHEGETVMRHGVFLGLREVGADIWEGMPGPEKRMFLRHFRRYWDIERHRVPPVQAKEIQQATAEGRFEVLRGRLAEVGRTPDGRVRAIVSTAHREACLEVDRIINCTGPDTDPLRSRNALLLDLLAQGRAAADPLGLGLHVNGACEVLGAAGVPSPRLYAIGPPTQGRFFEITGVPEIRIQARRLAASLAATLTAGTASLAAASGERR